MKKLKIFNRRYIQLKYCCDLPSEIRKRISIYQPSEERDLVFHHPIGVTIAQQAKIGKKCAILQNVTIGLSLNIAPIIGDNVIIFANCVIAGKTVIGNGAVIGAGSVVIDKIIGDNEVWAGNPAKFIKKKGE